MAQRYVTDGGATWTINTNAVATSVGSSIMASDHVSIIDDDLVGHVTAGGDFCLDLVTGEWSSTACIFNESAGTIG